MEAGLIEGLYGDTWGNGTYHIIVSYLGMSLSIDSLIALLTKGKVSALSPFGVYGCNNRG